MLPDEGWARVTLGWTGTGIPNGAASVFCVQRPVETPIEDVATEFGTALVASTLMAHLTNDVAITSITVKLGPDETGPMHVESVSIPGTQNVTMQTPNTCYLVRKSTASGGRRGSGRWFIPGVPEASVEDNGNLGAGIAAAIQTDLTALLNNMVGSELPLALEHFDETVWELDNGQPRRIPVPDTAPDPTLLTALTIDPRVATQRRRLR